MQYPTEPLAPERLSQAIWRPEDVGDPRLFDRLRQLPSFFLQRLEQSTSVMPRADRRGTQRFVDNKRVSATTLSERAEQFTVDALRGLRRVLFAHDSTEVNETGRGEPDDAGVLRSSHARGYMLHYSVAVTPDTHQVLGLLSLESWTRSWKLKGQNHKKRPAHDKESIKWIRGVRAVHEALARAGITCEVLHIFDREGDVYDNFTCAEQECFRLLVRAAQDRAIVEHSAGLWAYLREQSVCHEETRTVDNRVNVKARNAAKKVGAEALKAFDQAFKQLGPERKCTLELRFAKVTLCAPKGRKGQQRVWAVYVCERDAPAHVQPLEWLLLTNEEIDTAEAAQSAVSDYRARWKIGASSEGRITQSVKVRPRPIDSRSRSVGGIVAQKQDGEALRQSLERRFAKLQVAA